MPHSERYGIEGFEDHAMPCERCGELVVIASTDEQATAEHWANGVVRSSAPTAGRNTSAGRQETTMATEHGASYEPPSRNRRWLLVIDMDGDEPDDLAMKLVDIATDLRAGKLPTTAVFASPSCGGILRFEDRGQHQSVGPTGGDDG